MTYDALPSWQNVDDDRPTFVTHLECGLSGEEVPPDRLHGLSTVGRPFLVRYDLAAMARSLNKETLAARPPDMWRYREFLPVRANENIISLGECMTPLMPAPGVPGNLWIKDEGRLPTGSFKARGLCLAVSMAKELGVKRMAMPTNGNAGAAMAAYCRAAGIEAFVFCPDDTPETNIREIALQGARVYCVNGLINDCGKIVGDGKEAMNWFDASTLKEPYRIEGKKTMGLELAEQCGWQLPDAIFYPTGGGTGLIGMWKAFDELEAMGWIGSKRPKMIAVQASGCAPIVKAFEDGVEHAELWPDAHTQAAGIRVPAAVGDFLILRAVRQSGGFAIAIDDETIFAARDDMARNGGMLLCPEGAATYAAWQAAVADGRIGAQDRSILFNCATGLKYPMPEAGQTLDRHQTIDYGAMA
ncbi:MAG: threonine synthase [Alphaproteobacteria bacterium]|jgi:threonine synthase|nr:threonine synthase [Alphaproteobacteria bacterium]